MKILLSVICVNLTFLSQTCFVNSISTANNPPPLPAAYPSQPYIAQQPYQPQHYKPIAPPPPYGHEGLKYGDLGCCRSKFPGKLTNCGGFTCCYKDG